MPKGFSPIVVSINSSSLTTDIIRNVQQTLDTLNFYNDGRLLVFDIRKDLTCDCLLNNIYEKIKKYTVSKNQKRALRSLLTDYGMTGIKKCRCCSNGLVEINLGTGFLRMIRLILCK
jgi:hypothetical protein